MCGVLDTVISIRLVYYQPFYEPVHEKIDTFISISNSSSYNSGGGGGGGGDGSSYQLQTCLYCFTGVCINMIG